MEDGEPQAVLFPNLEVPLTEGLEGVIWRDIGFTEGLEGSYIRRYRVSGFRFRGSVEGFQGLGFRRSGFRDVGLRVKCFQVSRFQGFRG